MSFDVQDGFLRESLSFENYCIKENYFVLWNFGRELYCGIEFVSFFDSIKSSKSFLLIMFVQSPPCKYFQKTKLFLCPMQPYGFGDNCFHWTQMSFLLGLGQAFRLGIFRIVGSLLWNSSSALHTSTISVPLASTSMFVYELVTSIDTKMASCSIFVFSIKFIKSLVPFMLDCCFCAIGWSKASTNW